MVSNMFAIRFNRIPVTGFEIRNEFLQAKHLNINFNMRTGLTGELKLYFKSIGLRYWWISQFVISSSHRELKNHPPAHLNLSFQFLRIGLSHRFGFPGVKASSQPTKHLRARSNAFPSPPDESWFDRWTVKKFTDDQSDLNQFASPGFLKGASRDGGVVSFDASCSLLDYHDCHSLFDEIVFPIQFLVKFSSVRSDAFRHSLRAGDRRFRFRDQGRLLVWMGWKNMILITIVRRYWTISDLTFLLRHISFCPFVTKSSFVDVDFHQHCWSKQPVKLGITGWQRLLSLTPDSLNQTDLPLGWWIAWSTWVHFPNNELITGWFYRR
jgi:hypothetical protein